ncbi:hypothetical protein RGR602_PC00843 (plasmid) [Rhizobium gallicum bv. gallicum R602sp]|uniref:Uncharacterized protein n=1 Tax=Rhizobium gallicum bv. gallicum R602sp TaxID=1041138 RepID=A0A0B4XEF1_9HYPH|nr:hypothetical protein RGR602_PC00843 [Rhizobium gallicum bv. gallicum R602sp]
MRRAEIQDGRAVLSCQRSAEEPADVPVKPTKTGRTGSPFRNHLFDLNRRAGNAKQWHRRIFLRLDNHLEQLASLFGHTAKTCFGRSGKCGQGDHAGFTSPLEDGGFQSRRSCII